MTGILVASAIALAATVFLLAWLWIDSARKKPPPGDL